jgi:hypothetical protein
LNKLLEDIPTPGIRGPSRDVMILFNGKNKKSLSKGNEMEFKGGTNNEEYEIQGEDERKEIAG